MVTKMFQISVSSALGFGERQEESTGGGRGVFDIIICYVILFYLVRSKNKYCLLSLIHCSGKNIN